MRQNTSEFTSLQAHIIIIVCEFILYFLQDFVSLNLGQRFIEPQTAGLGLVFRDSSSTIPLIFVLSVGTDPAADLYKFAEEASIANLSHNLFPLVPIPSLSSVGNS